MAWNGISRDFRRLGLNRTVTWLFLVAIGIVLGSMFFVRSYHNFYWSNPATFIAITIIGVISALYGGFLAGNSLSSGKIRRGLLSKFLTGLGVIVSTAGGLLGLVAISMAIAISGTGYWGSPAPSEYSGDYLILGLQILVFRLSMLVEIIGGLILGYTLRKKERET
jgi:hypothetical protein